MKEMNQKGGERQTANRRATGSRYEARAAAYLEKKGYRILERNFRCRSGEIDLIARDGRYLVFIEVKYRRTGAAGYALDAVDARKAAKVRRVAGIYLMQTSRPETTPCRFDAIGIDGDAVTHIENAF